MLTRRAFSAALFLVPLQVSPRLPQPGVRYVPTPQNVVDAMLALARVTSADVVYDLGSGDGRFPITAAVKYGARGVGIEVDRFVLREAEDNVKRAGVGDRVRFVNDDLFTAPIGEATVVTLFLLPQMLDQLLPKLVRELRPGTRIVSHQYHFGDRRPAEKTLEVNGATVYLWTIGQSLK
jgi:SAM-dependent methyltransferase